MLRTRYPDKVKTFWGYGPDERTDKVAEAASHLQDKFEASLRRVKDFNRREDIFGLPVSECVPPALPAPPVPLASAHRHWCR